MQIRPIHYNFNKSSTWPNKLCQELLIICHKVFFSPPYFVLRRWRSASGWLLVLCLGWNDTGWLLVLRSGWDANGWLLEGKLDYVLFCLPSCTPLGIKRHWVIAWTSLGVKWHWVIACSFSFVVHKTPLGEEEKNCPLSCTLWGANTTGWLLVLFSGWNATGWLLEGKYYNVFFVHYLVLCWGQNATGWLLEGK